jgi:hypothetical protein
MNLVKYLGWVAGGDVVSPNDNGFENTGGFNWLWMTKRVCEHVNEPIDFTKRAVFLVI